MKICLAQIEVIPCRPDKNYETMTNAIVQAKSQKADMIVFPELCIPGYLIGDTWEELAYLKDCIAYGEQIREMADGIIIVFGNIAIDEGKTHQDGRTRKFNALFCAENKELRMFPGYTPYYIKSLLPNYREFEEPRHFTHSEEAFKGDFQCFSESYFRPAILDRIFIGFSICEDGWSKDYRLNPIKTYADNGAELIINISGSPFTIGKNGSRNKTFGEGHAKGNSIPLIYVNCVGIQNNGKNIYTFDGSSVAYNKKGEIVAHAPMFEECLLYVNYENGDILPGNIAPLPQTEIEEIEQALMYGARKFLQACGTNKVVIGLSGGIDSAASAVLYSKVVGPENLLLVNMPSKHNSRTTIGIAEQIARNIGCYYTSIDIEKSITLTLEQIQGLKVFQATNRLDSKEGFIGYCTLQLTDFHLENVQARDRGSRLLSAIASACGGVFPNNGNKSEITVGYCTFYGDLAGFLCTIGDLWKEQVYALARHLNDKYHLLPEEVFTVPASAELSEDHNVDKGKGDPLIFWYHDRLFQSWMQWWIRVTPEENLEWYIDHTINEKLHIPEGKSVYDLFPTKKEFCEDIEGWYRAFKGLAVAKRIQAPPIISISRRAFGFDYRETLNGCYFTRRYHELKGNL